MGHESGLFLAAALALLAGCEREAARPPSIAAASTASPHTEWRVTQDCQDRVEHSGNAVRPKASGEAIATHRFEDRPSGRILYFEILESGEANFYDNQRQRPDDAARPYCGWTRVGQSQIEKLEQTLVDHRFCAIRGSAGGADDAVHRLRMKYGRVNCEVSVTTRAMDESADAAATYRAITALEPRCPNEYWPCEVPGATPR